MTRSSSVLCLVVVCSLIGSGAHAANECMIDYDDSPGRHSHPFLVDKSRKVLMYPENGNRKIKIAEGSTVIASCPESEFIIMSPRSVSSQELTCHRSQLYNNKGPVDWATMRCRDLKPTLKWDGRCGKDGVQYRIGWTIDSHLFVPQITTCYDTYLEATMYTEHEIHGRANKEKKPSRPGFSIGGTCSASLPDWYTKHKQNVLAMNLGISSQLTTKGEEYFAKGHLAPDADFPLMAEQKATYYCVNVAPQWQAVNNGNWKKLEYAVRDLAKKRDATFKVYTGTHGILKLPDRTNNSIEVFLGLSSGEKKVPVPAAFWKVIHDPASRTAVAFVVMNEIRDNNLCTSRYPPCKDVCSRLGWFHLVRNDVEKGLTFCCFVDELHRVIPDVPYLSGVGLLA